MPIKIFRNKTIDNQEQQGLGVASISADRTIGDVGLYDGNPAWNMPKSIQPQSIDLKKLSDLSINVGDLTIDNQGFIRGGQTGYATGTGFWIGYDSTAYKFSIGDSTNYVTWDGTDLTIAGTLTVGSVGIQNLLDNGDFEDWSGGAAVAPDSWTLGGGGSVAREGAIIKLGTFSSAVTSDADGNQLYQAVHAEKGIDYWQSRTVTLSCWVYATVATIARLEIDDGVDITNSDYHAGDSTWSLMSITHTINAAATKLQIGLRVAGDTETAYFDGAMCVEGKSAMPFSPKYRQWGHPSDYTQIDGGDIYASTVTAGKISVTDLSAINADLGTITAGTITGGTIQTDAAASTGIKLDGSNLIAYDANGVEKFNIDKATGQFVHAQIPTNVSNGLFITGMANDGMNEINAGGITRDYSTTHIQDAIIGTDTGLNSGVLLHNGTPGNDWEHDMLFSVSAIMNSTTTQDAIWGIDVAATNTTPANATYTGRHIAFLLEDGTLYASNADGTTQTKTDVTSGTTLTNWNAYRIEVDYGTNIKFYINDSLKATHTTNMPATNGTPPGIKVILEGVGVGRQMWIGNNYQISILV